MEGRSGLTITVADTGIGMSAETLRKAFDPFFTTKRREGTGLGLSITRKLIDRQGGKIMVESEPGKGTAFMIWLPEAD
jgi:signal transduction histidine kinase